MKIVIKSLNIPMFLGVYEEEKNSLIHPELEITVFFKGAKVLKTKKLKDTVNYDTIIKLLETELSGQRFGLIEEVIDKIHLLLKREMNFLKLQISVFKTGTHTSVQSIAIYETFYKNFLCFLYCFIGKI